MAAGSPRAHDTVDSLARGSDNNSRQEETTSGKAGIVIQNVGGFSCVSVIESLIGKTSAESF